MPSASAGLQKIGYFVFLMNRITPKEYGEPGKETPDEARKEPGIGIGLKLSGR